METNIQLIQSLLSILEAEHEDKVKLIKKIQDKVWNDESFEVDKLSEVLSELAYDLDFYEPNKEWRGENPSYYGDDRLEEVIKLAVQKIQEKRPDSAI